MDKEMPSDGQLAELLQLPHLVLSVEEESARTVTDAPLPSSFPYETTDELVSHLSQILYPCIRGLVYRAHVSSWKGQEYDLIDDLHQVALLKILTYIEHCRRYAIPIYSLEHLSKVIARRCFLDLMRRDRRLQRFESEEHEVNRIDMLVDPAQQAEELVYEEEVLISAARIIATFPTKLRQAILADLGRESAFTATPSKLQRAFEEIGIRLQDYAQPAPTSKEERNKQTALRSLAYKRVAQEVRAQEAGIVEEDVACIQENTELASLARHLQRTRHCIAELSFRERLRAQLLASRSQPLLRLASSAQPKALVCVGNRPGGSLLQENETGYRDSSTQGDDADPMQVGDPMLDAPLLSLEPPAEGNALLTQKLPDWRSLRGHDEPDMATILDDPELAWLAKLLYAAVMPIPIDAAFQEQLRQRLLQQLREQQDTTNNL